MKVSLTIHPTINDIIKAFGSSKKAVHRLIEAQIEKAGCWGFIEDLETVNIYYNDQATKQNLLDLFAHEIAHTEYDKLKGKYNEEDFCTFTAELCVRAYDLMVKLRP